MCEPTADLSSIKLDPVFLKAWCAHVVDVKLKVSTVHDGQYQTQSVFGLIGVRQAHLKRKKKQARAQ